MDNEVRLRITAEDRVSAQIELIRARLANLSTVSRLDMAKATLLNERIQRLQDGLSGIGGTSKPQGMLGDVLFGNLGSDAIAKGVQLVTSQVNNLKNAIMSAARTQTLSLAQAGDLATKLGVPFKAAEDIVARTRVKVVDLADALPGETSDFNTYASTISSSIAGLSKGDPKKYEEMLLGMVEKYGVLGAIKGADAQIGAMALNKGIAGSSSLAELFKIELFARNPLLMEEIRAGAARDLKGRDWKSATAQERFKILNDAGNRALTGDTLASFEGKTEAIIQQAKTALLNEDKGLFGVLRKIPALNNRNTLDAVQTNLQAMVNLFTAVNRISKAAGLQFDPMVGVIGVIDWFTDLTNTVTGVLNGGQVGDITELFAGAWTSTIKIVNQVLDVFSKAIAAVPWTDVGNVMGSTMSQAVISFFTTLDWGQLLLGALGLIKASIEFQAGLVTGAIEGLFKQITKGIQEATGVAADPIGALARRAIPQPIQGIWDNSPEWLKQGASGVINRASGVTGVIRGTAESLKPLSAPKPPKDANTQAFAPTINVTGASGDPNAIAQSVLDAINGLYKDYQANSLA